MSALLQMSFDEARRVKYEAGRQEHRAASTDEFQGDPLEEIHCECLDLYNYFDEADRQGKRVPAFMRAAVRSIAQWSRESRSL